MSPPYREWAVSTALREGRRFGYADTPLGQLHYAEQGAGPPILLLHQTPRSNDEFAELMPELATAHRAIAMDMVGFGASAKIPAPQSIEQFAAGAIALLDALNIERASVLGHHTGGVVAVEVAATIPGRVDGLILSSTSWTDQEYRSQHAAGDGVDVVESKAGGEHLAELWALRQPFYPDARPDLLRRFVHDALAPAVDPGEGHLACARYAMEDRIRLVTAPTLLIGADEDPFAFPHLMVLARALSSASVVETVVVAGGMIPLMECHAPAVAAAVVPFLESARLGHRFDSTSS